MTSAKGQKRTYSGGQSPVEATDLEGVITDLLDSQYNNPIRVVGFNTAEGSSRGVSEDIADEIRRRCDLQMTEVPASLQAFVDRYENRDRKQLTLRLGCEFPKSSAMNFARRAVF